MQNMSYCRFENTLAALRECQDALNEAGNNPLDGLNEYELKAAKQLIKLCRKIADDYEDCA